MGAHPHFYDIISPSSIAEIPDLENPLDIYPTTLLRCLIYGEAF